MGVEYSQFSCITPQLPENKLEHGLPTPIGSVVGCGYTYGRPAEHELEFGVALATGTGEAGGGVVKRIDGRSRRGRRGAKSMIERRGGMFNAYLPAIAWACWMNPTTRRGLRRRVDGVIRRSGRQVEREGPCVPVDWSVRAQLGWGWALEGGRAGPRVDEISVAVVVAEHTQPPLAHHPSSPPSPPPPTTHYPPSSVPTPTHLRHHRPPYTHNILHPS